jgi:endonuclease/exonuclease/phosphatase family metal-dependent hydrolase
LRKILYRILLSVNIGFALTLLISYLAVIISPGKLALPAFFGLAYPYLLIINIILAVIWLMLLKFEALISIIVIALGFTHFINYIKLSRPAGDKTGTYKVMTYNVRLFNYFESRNGLNSEKKVLNFIKTQKPDIICLQEIYLIGIPSVREKAMVAALGGKYYSHMKVFGAGKNRYYGIITFSRFPIIRKGEIVHPGSSSLSIYTDIVVQKDTIRVYNNHLQSFKLKRMERSFVEELTSDKQTLEVKDISSSLKKGFIKRAHQAQVLKEKVDKSPYSAMVVGDFNDTPVSYAYRKIRKGLNDAFVNSGYGAGFTYRGNYPPNRIDYVLYDKSIVNSHFEIVRIRYSDHYPVFAYFKKNSKKAGS